MPFVPAPENQWYVIHCLSGYEQRVRENLLRRIQTEEMSDRIFQVLMPTEMVSEVKMGKRRETKRKFFPGYIIVNMHLLDEDGRLDPRTWNFVKDTENIIGFAGTKGKPLPMRQREVDELLSQINETRDGARPKISFQVGEIVKVADGAFENQSGVVEEIDHDRGKIRVSVTMFGRATPVELEVWQVERDS